eukprot:3933935-Rhodomonas_salina.6
MAQQHTSTLAQYLLPLFSIRCASTAHRVCRAWLGRSIRVSAGSPTPPIMIPGIRSRGWVGGGGGKGVREHAITVPGGWLRAQYLLVPGYNGANCGELRGWDPAALARRLHGRSGRHQWGAIGGALMKHRDLEARSWS